MKPKEVAIYAGIAFASFAAYRIITEAAKKAKAGMNAVTAISSAAKNIVTTDLNPASDQNLIYRASNSLIQGATGRPDETLGGFAYDSVNSLSNWWATVSNASMNTVFGTPADTPQQAFREAEIIQQNKDALALRAADVKMSDAKSEFRLLEYQDQKIDNGEISTGVAFGIYPKAF